MNDLERQLYGALERHARKAETMKTANTIGDLCDYATGDTIRPATAEEREASIEAAKHDGGSGVILVDGRTCYVED